MGGAPVKVLLLHNQQRQRGGADVVLEREADALAARGHAVDRLIVATPDVEAQGPLVTGIDAFWNREAVARLRDRIAADRPDVVHVHTPFPVLSPAVIRVASRSGLPVVVTSHSWRFSCPNGLLHRDGAICEECVGRRVKLPAVRHRCYHDALGPSVAIAGSLTLHHLTGTFARHVDRFLALTPFMRERLIAEGLHPRQVEVKANAAPDPGPPPDQRDDVVLFAGRLVEVKGVETLLAAWRHSDLDVRLVIAGDGPLAPAVERAAASDARISALGWVENPVVTDLLRRAQAAVLPSTWYEGLPIALTEAFAAGTPVIASEVGNFSDLVEPGRTGTRFAPGDGVALAGAVRWLMTEADRPAMRAACREVYERDFAEPTVLDHLETVYATVIAERAARHGAPRC